VDSFEATDVILLLGEVVMNDLPGLRSSIASHSGPMLADLMRSSSSIGISIIIGDRAVPLGRVDGLGAFELHLLHVVQLLLLHDLHFD